MKLRLQSKNRMPHGGMYELDRPDMGMVGKGTTWDMVRDRIMAYRKANGIPIGLGFEDELEQALCVRYPAECDGFSGGAPKLRTLGLHDVVVGSKVMLSVLGSASPLVDRAEAERRARICQDCPFNTGFSKPCSGICAELVEVVKFITGNQGTQYDMNLKSCNVCGCYLPAAIWVRADLQIAPLSDDQKQQFEAIEPCWKKQSLLTAASG